MAGRGHNGHGWRVLRRAVLGLDEPDRDIYCWLCKRFIDKTLRWPHPASPSVDMVVPHSHGGDPRDPANLRPAHLAHNTGRRDRSASDYQAKLEGRPTEPRPRRWIADSRP